MPDNSMMDFNARGIQSTEKAAEALAPQGAKPDRTTLGHLEGLAWEYIEHYDSLPTGTGNSNCRLLALNVLRAIANREVPPGYLEALAQSILRASEANRTSVLQDSQDAPLDEAWLWSPGGELKTWVPNRAQVTRLCDHGFVIGLLVVMPTSVIGLNTGKAIGLITMGITAIFCLGLAGRLPDFIPKVAEGVHMVLAALRGEIPELDHGEHVAANHNYGSISNVSGPVK